MHIYVYVMSFITMSSCLSCCVVHRMVSRERNSFSVAMSLRACCCMSRKSVASVPNNRAMSTVPAAHLRFSACMRLRSACTLRHSVLMG